jgi:uncharacterized phage-like protein YoqJ
VFSSDSWQPTGKVCCFSGYRPPKLPFYSEEDPECIALKARLKEEIYSAAEDGFTEFLCGMALGSDTWAAEAVLEVKEALSAWKELRLHAILPFPGQAERWSAKNRRRYHGILSRCNTVETVSSEYLPDCMERRNRIMVDRSQRLVAVFDGKSGGTKNTILLAHEKGIEIRILSPIPPAHPPQTRSPELQKGNKIPHCEEPDDPQIKLFF